MARYLSRMSGGVSMERLTKRIGNTVDFANGRANLKDHKANVKMLFKRLAEYEDTGLTPEEIKEQIEILEHNYKCMEDTLERQYDNARKLLDELKKDCDYWKREALKWASKLGEQKIERGN